MKVSELVTILNTFEKNSDVIVYNGCTDASYDISCIDIDDDDTENNPKVIIFI